MGWEDAPITQARAAAPWEAAPIVTPRRQRTAVGVLDAIQAGYQGGATGLALRGRLPDVVLDPHYATWYEKAAAGISQVVTEMPEMIAGAAIGAPAGAAAGAALTGPAAPVGGIVGGILGTGAGAFAVPAAIRTSLIEAYKSGTAQSSGGFLASAKIILKQTAKEAGIGAATLGAGAVAGRLIGSVAAPLIGETIGVQTATRAIGVAATTAEIGTMVVTPAALEGRLPEWEEFLNAAIVLGGVKASVGMAHKLGDVYARTGIPPEEVVAAAKVDQKIVEELKAETSELPTAFRAAANDASAREAILEPNAARAFVEKPFAEVPQAPGTPKVKLNVNYDYINTPDEAKAALARASELYGPTIIEQTRGKVSWDATEADAATRLAEMIGTQDRALLNAREPGTAANATELLLRRQVLEGAVEDFTRKAQGYDPANSPPEAAIQMMAAAERVAMLSAYFQGAASEAGRALNILKNARDSARSAEEVARLLKVYDRDPAQIAAIMKQAENPVQAAAAARAIVKASTWEKVVEGMKSFMISGPITTMANVIGNATFIPLRPVVDLVAAPIGALRGGAERVAFAEPAARLAGNFQGMVDALVLAGKFIDAYKTKPMEGLRKLDAMSGRKTESQKRAIEGDLGVFIRSPFLTLSIPDQLFRMMIERGEANAIAARQAAKDGLTPGSREFSERMAEVRQNLTADQQAHVEALGMRGTFNADLGKVGKKAQELIKASHTEWLFPFVRTPANIAKELIRLTPAAPIIDTWRADMAKGGPAADKALAEMLVGGMIAAVVIGYAQAGIITGAGDPDPNKKRVDLAAGQQSYSFKSEEGVWYELSRLQPIGTLINLAADFSEIWDRFENPEERDKVLRMIGTAFSSAITNQTMLQGLTSIVRAISEPDRNFERTVQNLAAMPIPGAVAQWSQLNDPYLREVHGIIDAIKNRTPLRTTLQPKVDVWGEFIENRERVGGIGPVRKMTESTDKVKTEAARLGVSVPKTPEKIQLPGAKGDRKLASVELTPEQQTAYAVIAGKTAHELLQPIVNAPDWDSKPDMVQKMTYDLVFERSRTVARGQVLPMEQREAEQRRIAEEVLRRLSAP